MHGELELPGQFGELGAFADAGLPSTQKDAAGYGGFMSGSLAYILGGDQAGVITSNILDGDLEVDFKNGTVGPDLANFNDAAVDLVTARYLYGYTRTGAFNYLVGGQGAAGVLRGSELNVR